MLLTVRLIVHIHGMKPEMTSICCVYIKILSFHSDVWPSSQEFLATIGQQIYKVHIFIVAEEMAFTDHMSK